ncbi:uncharacterized protein K441DRAFT_155278 [Cenococcum geophilum 1.58]|uniref:uncharacterized protein n=1 Tax=Cenococcum geophilum 1.58 TaxID=794803 RepID=UPI00358FA5C0|nr:hypothetical protein K441DRAFT_155278 [Cenococcum geophilum 1.58]
MSKDASGLSPAILIPQHLVSLSLETMHHQTFPKRCSHPINTSSHGRYGTAHLTLLLIILFASIRTGSVWAPIFCVAVFPDLTSF